MPNQRSLFTTNRKAYINGENKQPINTPNKQTKQYWYLLSYEIDAFFLTYYYKLNMLFLFNCLIFTLSASLYNYLQI